MAEPVIVEPLIIGAVLTKVVLASGASLIVGFLGKGVWDYFSGGRVEKTPVYMTMASCRTVRNGCNLPILKDHIYETHEQLVAYKAQTDARLTTIDRRLDESSIDIKAMRHDISEIKAVSAASNAILETIQRGMEKHVYD